MGITAPRRRSTARGRGPAQWFFDDLACGTGLLATRLERTFPDVGVVGCDYSRGMLLRAAARLPEGAWVQADAQRLPFQDRAFDAVVCTEALHWFPDQVRALAECRRVASRIVGQPFRWPTRAGMRALFAAAGLEVEAQRRILRIPAGVLLPPVLAIGVRAPQAS